MAYPSSAKRRTCRYVVHYGPLWEPFVDDSNSSEGDLDLTDNIELGPPLVLIYAGETRVVGGQTLNWGSPGLHTWGATVSGIDSTRWARVMAEPTDGQSADEPIRCRADVGDDPDVPWCEITAWTDALVDGGFGGSRVQLTIFDPHGLHAGQFVEGRSISIRPTEYEDGAVYSDSELFSGFVDPSEAEDTISGAPATYTISASTIESLIGREGMDAAASLFLDHDYAHSVDLTDPVGPAETDPGIALIAANPYHVMTPLTPFKALAHVLLWHLWVKVGTITYRLAQLVNMRSDYWNAPENQIPVMAVPQGNLMSAIVGFLPQGEFIGYSFRTSDFTITPDHEFKDSADSTVIDVDTDTVYSIRRAPGRGNLVGQVVLIQSVSIEASLKEDPKIAKYPSTKGDGSQKIIHFALFTDDDTATGIAHSYYDKYNATDRIVLMLPGAPVGPHNTLTLDGDKYTVLSVTHGFLNPDAMGGHVTWVTCRAVG